MRTRHVVAVIAGAVAALTAAALLLGGGALLTVHATQRDDDGFYTAGPERLRSEAYAVTAEHVDRGPVRPVPFVVARRPCDGDGSSLDADGGHRPRDHDRDHDKEATMRMLDRRTGLDVLMPDECLALLAADSVGRIAVVDGFSPVVFPVNYLDWSSVVVRMAEGERTHLLPLVPSRVTGRRVGGGR